jgi:RecB family exonuclease
VDRLERDDQGRLVVLDLKTSSTKPAGDEIRRHAQLGAYQVAVAEGAFDRLSPGSTSGGAELVHLGATGPVTQAQPAVGEDEDPGWARAMVLRAGTGMAGHRFAAHDLGQRCRSCPARFSCPLQPEGQAR